MAEEIPETIIAKLTKKGITIPDPAHQAELEKRGYGTCRKQAYLLEPYEALSLLHQHKLQLLEHKQPLTLEQLTRKALQKDPTAWTKFLVYRDLRSRGYTAKEGFGFGADFRVYERGEYGTKPAKYVVFALNEGTEMKIQELNDAVHQITRMGKEPIIAVVERRGEVIYYKVSPAHFTK